MKKVWIVFLCIIVIVCLYVMSIHDVSDQSVVILPDKSEQKVVMDSELSKLYTDQQLLDYANEHIEDYWHVYYGFMTGTYFECGDGLNGYHKIVDSNIH